MEPLLGQMPLRFSRLPMFPFFDLAHYTASIMAVKEQRGAVEVSYRSPIACWFSAMLYCFGGSILSSLMLAEPPVAFLANTTSVLLASSVWYLIFYCPHDLAYRCVSFPPIRLMVAGMKEVTRTWKITGGVAHAHSHYNNAWMVMIVIGWARGAGGGLISNFEQLVRGVWKPETNELLKMSYPVKISLVGAVLFTMQQTLYLPVEKHNLMFFYTIFLVSTKCIILECRKWKSSCRNEHSAQQAHRASKHSKRTRLYEEMKARNFALEQAQSGPETSSVPAVQPPAGQEVPSQAEPEEAVQSPTVLPSA
ncbi:hypothetical protein JD844_009530, partial [Phrynosoma platyrhinos]